MKRIIPIVLLAFVAVACERDGPTVPLDGPPFAVDCDDPKFENHPKCTGGGGGDEGYTAIDLKGLGGNKGKDAYSGVAHDINESNGGLLQIVGWSAIPRHPVVWTGGLSEIGSVDPEDLLPAGYDCGIAEGISDNGSMIVGSIGVDPDCSHPPPTPAVFSGGGVWGNGQLLELPTGCNHHGRARDVNDSGLIAGWCYTADDSPPQPVVWEPGQPAQPLSVPAEFPGGWASGLNNDGWIVGSIGEEGGVREAVLWRPDGTTCNLHPEDWGSSAAWRMTDLSGSTFLVAGARDPDTDPEAAVWQVTVDGSGCSSEVVALPVSGAWALDVTGVFGDWQAAGTDWSVAPSRPVTWTYSEGTVLDDVLPPGSGGTYVINGAGHIVGRRNHKNGTIVPVLWTK